MKTNKEYRFYDNPKEKEMHDKFIAMFDTDSRFKDTLSAIIFGWKNDTQTVPNRDLTEDERNICLTLIQWLGSPVGQSFLQDCGFSLNTEREKAMLWWNTMNSGQKTQICDTNTEIVGSVRRWETLTGREIEYLYHKYC